MSRALALIAIALAACEPSPAAAPVVSTQPFATDPHVPAVAVPAVPFPVGSEVEVEWRGKWYPATVLAVTPEGWSIHYEGYGDEWDEVVGRERIRAR